MSLAQGILVTLVLPLHERAGQHEVGRGPVAGDRRVVHDGNPQERLDVDIVRLWLERIREEDDKVDAPLGKRRSNLLVASERTAEESGDGQPEFPLKKGSGRARREQLVALERRSVPANPLEQAGFLMVVGDEGDPLLHRHARGLDVHRCLRPVLWFFPSVVRSAFPDQPRRFRRIAPVGTMVRGRRCLRPRKERSVNPKQAEFYSAVETFVDAFLRQAPVAATELGDHRFDGILSRHTPEALRSQEAQLRDGLRTLVELDVVGFTPDAAIDHVVMVHLVRAFLRDFDPLRSHERSPGTYIEECLGGVFLLLIRDFVPFPARMRLVLGRLREVPRVLAEAKQVLVPEQVPPVWAEMALDSAAQGRGLFTVLVPFLALRTPWLFPQIVVAARRAARALDSYARFLRKDVAPRARGDFAVGKVVFEEMLHDQHLLDVSADELLQIGQRLFDETQRSMDELGRKLSPTKSARQILEEAKKSHPEADELLETYRREVARARAFVVEHGIATIPDGETLRIEPTPAYLRGVLPYAAYMPAGLLESKQEGVFLVTPVPRRASVEAREAKLRGHNTAKLPLTTLHEGYPGHHLQLVHANRTATLPRKLASALSSLFVEGWAFYCEELMEQLGYLTDPVQPLARRKDQLWRAARIILDVSLHTRGMTVKDAIAFLVNRVGLEPDDAKAEVHRYTQNPTQPMSYLIGKLEILKLIDAYKAKHPGTPLREMHDAMLACGSLPPKLMAQKLLAGS